MRNSLNIFDVAASIGGSLGIDPLQPPSENLRAVRESVDSMADGLLNFTCLYDLDASERQTCSNPFLNAAACIADIAGVSPQSIHTRAQEAATRGTKRPYDPYKPFITPR